MGRQGKEREGEGLKPPQSKFFAYVAGTQQTLKVTNLITICNTCWLAVWLSGNALALINVVALRQTRLVPGWVTVCGRVNHLGM